MTTVASKSLTIAMSPLPPSLPHILPPNQPTAPLALNSVSVISVIGPVVTKEVAQAFTLRMVMNSV